MIRLLEEAFDPWVLLAERFRQADDPGTGARDLFIGYMRDANEGHAVQRMVLEHYPGMTERVLAQIVAQAQVSWSLRDVLVAHRVGLLLPSQAIVVVAVSAAHRAPAFAACREIVERLKHEAPFWKKEWLADGRSRWVEHNTAP
jgi:molybdopterin synthase catalytic subunit